MAGRTTVALGLALAFSAGNGNAVPVVPPPKPVDGGAPLTWKLKPGFFEQSREWNRHGTPQGVAEVECVINKRGQPADCVVIRQEPPDSRVGELVIGVAGIYRASSKDAEGRSPVGRRVRFTMGFGRGKVP